MKNLPREHVPPSFESPWFTQLVDTFKCHVCYISPIKPPVIVTCWCKNILGCEACIDMWYSGDEARVKTCLLCRSERAYSETNRLHGVDNFLNVIRPLLSPSDNIDDSGPGPSSYYVPPPPEYDSDVDGDNF